MTDYIHVSDGGEVSFIPGEMTDNRTTELLRELLDERGVEWKDGDAAYEIEWSTPDGRHCSAMYWKPTFTVLVSGCTPEQAVAATLGRDRDEIYNAGFDNGVQAVFQQLEGIEDYDGLQDLIAEYWGEGEGNDER